MGTRECSICLDNLKYPIATPCGHVHCEDCLMTYVDNASDDAVNAPCPTCRAPFPLVQPDLRFIPKKFHPFIMPSIRRVYLPEIDLPDNQTHLAQVRELEKRVKSLKKDKCRLMDRCDSLIAERDGLAEKEREAREQLEDLEEEYNLLSDELEEAKTRAVDLEEELHAADVQSSKWKGSFGSLNQKYKQMIKKLDDANKELHHYRCQEQKRLKEERSMEAALGISRNHKRTSDQAALDSPSASSYFSSSPEVRVIAKRPRLAPFAKNVRPPGPYGDVPPPGRSTSRSIQLATHNIRRAIRHQVESGEESNDEDEDGYSHSSRSRTSHARSSNVSKTTNGGHRRKQVSYVEDSEADLLLEPEE